VFHTAEEKADNDSNDISVSRNECYFLNSRATTRLPKSILLYRFSYDSPGVTANV
jgi:hypothetical protein